MSAAWRAIFEPKNKGWDINEVYKTARLADYPFFCHDGKIYRAEAERYKLAPTSPEVLDEPQVFAVMDKEEKQILMLQGEVPFLFLDIALAIAVASKSQGVVKPLGEALYLNREASKNASPIITPTAPAIITARG